MDIKGSKTLNNIEESFVNEAKAIISYLIFADTATAEGNLEAAELFKRMAKNETEHAKAWFKYLYDMSGSTAENLSRSADSENCEWKTYYPEAAKTAKEEGLDEVAAMFERISSIECDHERRFVEMILSEKNSEEHLPTQNEHVENSLFCLFCGYPSVSPIEVCPVCGAMHSFVGDNK